MHTNVIFIPTDSNFKPNVFAIFIREDGSMKDEVYNLTLHEVKILIKQLEESIKEA